MLFTSFVLSNLYTGVFTSLLAVPNVRVLATSIEQIAENEKIHVYGYRATGTTDYILVKHVQVHVSLRMCALKNTLKGAKGGRLKRIGDQMRKYGTQLVNESVNDMTDVVRGNNVFVTVRCFPIENPVSYVLKL